MTENKSFWSRVLNNKNSLMNALILIFASMLVTICVYQLIQVNEFFKKGKLAIDIWDRIVLAIILLISNPFSFMLGFYFRTQGSGNEFEKLIDKNQAVKPIEKNTDANGATSLKDNETEKEEEISQ